MLSQQNLSIDFAFLMARSCSLKCTKSNPLNCSLYCLNHLLYFDIYDDSDLCQERASLPLLFGPVPLPSCCGGLDPKVTVRKIPFQLVTSG